jgi:hypothetical protein
VISSHGNRQARVKLRPVTTKRLGIVATVFVVDALLLLIVGAAMWSEPPSPADEAVGKGLAALGVVLGIPAFVLVCAFLSSRAQTAPAQEAPRSDWDPV